MIINKIINQVALGLARELGDAVLGPPLLQRHLRGRRTLLVMIIMILIRRRRMAIHSSNNNTDNNHTSNSSSNNTSNDMSNNNTTPHLATPRLATPHTLALKREIEGSAPSAFRHPPFRRIAKLLKTTQENIRGTMHMIRRMEHSRKKVYDCKHLCDSIG